MTQPRTGSTGSPTAAKIPLRQYAALLARYLRPQWVRVVVLAILIFTSIGLNLLNPQIIRYFIDTAKEGGTLANLSMAAGLFLAVGIVRQLVYLGSSYMGQDVGWRATNRMRGELADHCLQLDMAFHNERTPGEMVERVDGDTTALANFFSEFAIQVLGSVVFLLGVLVLVFREDWRIGLALTGFTVVAFIVYNLVRNIAVPLYTAEREGYSRLFGFIEERLTGIEDIRTNGGNPYIENRFFTVNRDTYDRVFKSDVIGAVLRSITTILFAFGHALAMGMGIYLFQEGTFTIGAVYLIFHYTTMLRWPLFQLSRQINEMQRATAGFKRIQELHEIRSKLPDGHQTLPGIEPLSVEFDRVNFSYFTDEPVLHDLSFHLEAGKTLGLLGRTGSGKTTITRLLFRLYAIDSGRIHLGGHSIDRIRRDQLRHRVGMVTQDVQIFNASVRQNLSLFDPTIADAQILAVIEELELAAWYTTLADGLDTPIAADSLSAGESQLLAFARVFLKNPGLIILDEPSSRLDPATEQQIDRAVDRLLANRTAIVIAHHLATVQRVDEIMILADGHCREYGERQALGQDPQSHFARLLAAGLEDQLT